MGVAAGIAILAALTHGLVGFSRRPPDRARIAFAIAAAAAAVGALSVLALYTIHDIDLHIAVMKWAYFPATVVWTVAVVWFVAFVADVRPMRFLLALTAGFAFTLVVNVVLPHGILHEQKGGLMEMDAMGGSVMVMTQSSPHVLQNVTDALTLISFAFLCYAVYRVYRRPAQARARYLGLMTALLAVATLFDAIIEHRVVITFNTLYLSQVSFAVVIIAVSLVLRRESLRVEMELQLYRTHMDELVEARVRELDEANARLAEESRERRATEEVLRRRVEELDALQRMAQVLGGRTTLGQALDEATSAIAGLFKARYARVRLLTEGEAALEAAVCLDAAAAPTTGDGNKAGRDGIQALTDLDLAVTDTAMGDCEMVAEDVAAWPDLPDEVRRQARQTGSDRSWPRRWWRPRARPGRSSSPGTPAPARSPTEEQQLAADVGEALAAVIEIDRLLPPGDKAGGRGGAPGAGARPARRRDPEHLQRLADRRGAAGRVGTRPGRGRAAISSACAGWSAPPWPRCARCSSSSGRRRSRRRRSTRCSSASATPSAGRRRSTVDIEVDEAVALPPDVKIVFYRVTQEAFSNIAKHARASSRDRARRWPSTAAPRSRCRTTAEASTRRPCRAATWDCSIMSERLRAHRGHARRGEHAGRGDDHPRGVAATCFGRAAIWREWERERERRHPGADRRRPPDGARGPQGAAVHLRRHRGGRRGRERRSRPSRAVPAPSSPTWSSWTSSCR